MIAGAARIIFVLFCTDKRTKEGCDLGSDVGSVQSRHGCVGPVLLKKP